MSWVFSSPSAPPNYDSTPDVAIAQGTPAAVTAFAVVLFGLFLRNNGSGADTVTVTDTAGHILVKVKVPANGEAQYSWPMRPTTGLKAGSVAGTSTLHAWGYLAT